MTLNLDSSWKYDAEEESTELPNCNPLEVKIRSADEPLPKTDEDDGAYNPSKNWNSAD